MNLRVLSDEELLRHADNERDPLITTALELELAKRLDKAPDFEEEIEALETKVEKLEEEIARLETQNGELEAERDDLKDELATATQISN